jgi:hypothetical protein
MRTSFRMTDLLLRSIHLDLDRQHPFAAERVGFVTCGIADLPDEGFEVYAAAYHPVLDEDYIEDHRVGAMLGPGAFRKMLQTVYHKPAAVFHVHRHDHRGAPLPSRIDESESRKFIPDFWKVCAHHPHGVLILSFDSIYGQVWHPDRRTIRLFDSYRVIGDLPPSRQGLLDERA